VDVSIWARQSGLISPPGYLQFDTVRHQAAAVGVQDREHTRAIHARARKIPLLIGPPNSGFFLHPKRNGVSFLAEFANLLRIWQLEELVGNHSVEIDSDMNTKSYQSGIRYSGSNSIRNSVGNSSNNSVSNSVQPLVFLYRRELIGFLDSLEASGDGQSRSDVCADLAVLGVPLTIVSADSDISVDEKLQNRIEKLACIRRVYAGNVVVDDTVVRRFEVAASETCSSSGSELHRMETALCGTSKRRVFPLPLGLPLHQDHHHHHHHGHQHETNSASPLSPPPLSIRIEQHILMLRTRIHSGLLRKKRAILLPLMDHGSNPLRPYFAKYLTRYSKEGVEEYYKNNNVNIHRSTPFPVTFPVTLQHSFSEIKQSENSNPKIKLSGIHQTGQTLNRFEYLTELASYFFVLCPPGRGYDTFRTWETVSVGSIPIVMPYMAAEKENKFNGRREPEYARRDISNARGESASGDNSNICKETANAASSSLESPSHSSSENFESPSESSVQPPSASLSKELADEIRFSETFDKVYFDSSLYNDVAVWMVSHPHELRLHDGAFFERKVREMQRKLRTLSKAASNLDLEGLGGSIGDIWENNVSNYTSSDSHTSWAEGGVAPSHLKSNVTESKPDVNVIQRSVWAQMSVTPVGLRYWWMKFVGD
jgi:hypothetical protein